MKKIIIALLGIIPLLVSAQDVKFTKDFNTQIGPEYKVIDAASKHYYEIDNEIINIKTDKEKVFLQKIDGGSLEEVTRKEYEDFPKKMEFRFSAQADDRLYYFFTVWDRKEKQERFYVREINVDEGTFLKSKLLFSTSDKVLPSTIKNIYSVLLQNSSDYDFTSSFDDEKYLIQYRLKPLKVRDKINKDVLGFHVFDNEFNELWYKEIAMPYTEKEMNNIAYTVSSNGTVYMIAYINATSSYEFFEIAEDTDIIKPVALNLDGNLFFNNISMTEKSNGNITCIGYYANGIDFKYDFFTGGGLQSTMNINGIIQFTLNPDGEVVLDNKVDFPVDFINQYENNRTRNKNEKRESKGKLGIKNLKLRTWYEFEDGSSLIVGEQFFSEFKIIRTPARTIRTLHHYYEDVVATKIDADGSVLWMKKLPKEQEKIINTDFTWNWRRDNRGGLSIKHVYNGEDHYILFLDNVKNLALPIDQRPARHIDGKGGFLTAYKVNDDTGEVEKLSIFDSKDVNGKEIYQFRTSRMLLSEDNNLYLEVYMKGKKDALLKINLEK